MKKVPVVLIALCLVLRAVPGSACTNAVLVADAGMIAASNLDTKPSPRVWFIPAEEGRYGRFCFGTDTAFRIAEGGFNEAGLFIAVNALDADTGWAPDPALPDWVEWSGWYETGVPDGILANCATVAEAVEVFRNYNLLTLQRVKFLLADRGGASAVIEWGAGGLVVLPRAGGNHQISTNVLTAALASGEASCARYQVAERILSTKRGGSTIDVMRALLSATHLEFYTPTIFSGIFDLASGSLSVYYFHNYEEVVTFDLATELAKGRQEIVLADLFEVRPTIATVYGK